MSMFTKCLKLTKKSAVIFIIIVAAIMLAAVMLRSSPGCSFGVSELINVTSTEGRIKYLTELGWEADVSTEECKTVLIPKKFEGVMLSYSKLQTEQGYDFASFGGLECRQYTYVVTNYPNSDGTVYATLYVKGGHVIGGDIHSANIDGFMHTLK